MTGISRENKDESFGVDYFEEMYRREDPWDYSRSTWEIQRHHRMLDMIAASTPARALDFGCGEGYFTRKLRSVCDKVVGMDQSPTAISRARAAGGPAIEYVVGDHAKLDDGRLGSFDLIVSLDVLDYLASVKDVGEVLRRFNDRLLPGGTLALTVAFRRAGKTLEDAVYRWDKCTRADWANLLTRHFEMVHQEVLDSRVRQWVLIRRPRLSPLFDLAPMELALRVLGTRLPDRFGGTLALIARKPAA